MRSPRVEGVPAIDGAILRLSLIHIFAAGATADRISFGNTIKKERDVVRAMELGVRLFAVDCTAEVEKVARSAEKTGTTDARIFCRILCDGAGADWPLSRKFGCVPEMAADVLEHGHRMGLLMSLIHI